MASVLLLGTVAFTLPNGELERWAVQDGSTESISRHRQLSECNSHDGGSSCDEGCDALTSFAFDADESFDLVIGQSKGLWRSSIGLLLGTMLSSIGLLGGLCGVLGGSVWMLGRSFGVLRGSFRVHGGSILAA